MARRSVATAAGSVSGFCRNRQLRPTTSAAEYPVAAENAGKFLLGRLNVDAAPGIVQALQLQAVPTVIALIGGQVAPLFQGVLPKAEVQAYLDQLLTAAVANGIVSALQHLGDEATKPLVVRLDGNNVEEGRRILAEANHPLVTVVDTMDGAARRAAELAA